MNREEEIFEAAAGLPEAERPALLDAGCAGQPEMRARIESLLRSHDATGFMEVDVVTGGAAFEAAWSRSFPEEAGQQIGHYKILEQIGEGGFGVVWEAEQFEPVRRRVALKIIKPGMDSREVVARFEQERQALAMMEHPGIARVFDAGATDRGRPYFVMELVHGSKITGYCDEAGLSTEARLRLFITVCQAVQHAHQKGIIHRDLKPSNILVEPGDGGAPLPKIIDFGVAKAMQQALTDDTVYTPWEQMIGTPAYMSPEQAGLGPTDIDTRSDVYSLGVLLYELLAGRPPFDSKELLNAGPDEMRRIIREVEPQRPSTRVSTLERAALAALAGSRQSVPPKLLAALRGDLDWIVMKALEKDRTRRYETASGLAADVERFLADQPITAGPPSAVYRLRKFARRNKAAVLSAAAIFTVLAGAAVVSAWQAVRATTAETRANRKTADEKSAREDAEAVSKFLTEVFESPDPARDGHSITVAELLGRTKRKLDVEFAGQPGRRVNLERVLCRTFNALGLSAEAVPIQEKLRDFAVSTFGPEHINTIGAMNDLAVYYHGAGRYKESLKLQEEVLMLRRKVLGPVHADTVAAMENLANFYLDAGRSEAAFKMQDEVLTFRRKELGPEHPYTLTVMANLANIYEYSGRVNEALRMREELLPLSRKVNGREHPNTLNNIGNLASSYDDAGRTGEALKLQAEVLTLRRKVSGPDHPDTLMAMINMAAYYSHSGSRDEAFKLREEVFMASLKALGPEHSNTLTAMSSLANSFEDLGRADEALKMREELLVLSRKVLGPEHLITIKAMMNLSNSCEDAGRMDEAFKMREESLSLSRKVLGPEHPDTLSAMSLLASSNEDAGRTEEALRMREEVLTLTCKVLGPEHPNAIKAMINLSNSYDGAGRKEEALKMAEQVLTLSRKVLGPDHPDTLLAMTNLSCSYFDAGRKQEALELREKVLPVLRKVLIAEDLNTLKAIGNLANSYEDAGRKEEAAALRKELTGEGNSK